MKNFVQDEQDAQKEQERNGSAPASNLQRFGRRAFIVTAAGAVSGAVLVGLRSSLLIAPQPVDAANAPSSVTIVEFGPDGKKTGKVTVAHIAKTDDEWKKQLSPVSYDVTRRAGTERAYTGDTWNNHDKGIYRCICCDTAAFSSATKFESGTGWPSFWEPIARENVVETQDPSMGMDRTAVSCRRCDAHLGHVFDDGPRPTGLRYCMNSAAMKFVKIA
jgi:peptide-methionine (R)-S-oxide reductase